MDEPLGALDLKLRKQMQIELKKLQKKLQITFVYVTHDQEEALNMSDRIAVMNEGIIEQIGSPEDIYERPKTKFVASFIGESNLIKAEIKKIDEEMISVQFGENEMKVNYKNYDNSRTKGSYILIRPENIKYSRLKPQNVSRPPYGFKSTIKEHSYIGSIIKTTMTLENGQEIMVCDYDKKKDLISIGNEVWVYFEPEDVVIVEEVGE